MDHPCPRDSHSHYRNCQLCKVALLTRDDYIKHMVHCHGVEQPVTCCFCDKQFSTFQSRNLHLRKAHGTKRCSRHNIDTREAVCLQCGQEPVRFKSMKKLADHCASVHGYTTKNAHSLHACTIPMCNKIFWTSAGLQRHVRHHKLPGQPLQCRMCTKLFKNNYTRHNHEAMVHFGIKPFECPVCKLRQSFKRQCVNAECKSRVKRVRLDLHLKVDSMLRDSTLFQTLETFIDAET